MCVRVHVHSHTSSSYILVLDTVSVSLEVRLTITILFFVWRLEHVECSSLSFPANFAICIVTFIDYLCWNVSRFALCWKVLEWISDHVGFTWMIQYACLLRSITKVYSGYDASILMLLMFCIRFIKQDQNSIPYERELIFSTEARSSEYSLMHLKLGVFFSSLPCGCWKRMLFLTVSVQ